MTKKKILAVVELYRERFEAEEIPKIRLGLDDKFCSRWDMLAHAHYLLDGIVEYVENPEQVGETGRHLGCVQVLLIVCGCYTIREVMNHNRPDES